MTAKRRAMLGDILDCIKDRGPITRDDIAAATGIPRTTVHDLLFGHAMYKDKRLHDMNIRRFMHRTGDRGRPRVYYEVEQQ